MDVESVLPEVAGRDGSGLDDASRLRQVLGAEGLSTPHVSMLL